MKLAILSAICALLFGGSARIEPRAKARRDCLVAATALHPILECLILREIAAHSQSLAWANPDAVAWYHRGNDSASMATLTNVSAFCDSIDAAGLRTNMSRVSFFLGSGEDGAKTPIYIGPAIGEKDGPDTDTFSGFTTNLTVAGLIGDGAFHVPTTANVSNLTQDGGMAGLVNGTEYDPYPDASFLAQTDPAGSVFQVGALASRDPTYKLGSTDLDSSVQIGVGGSGGIAAGYWTFYRGASTSIAYLGESPIAGANLTSFSDAPGLHLFAGLFGSSKFTGTIGGYYLLRGMTYDKMTNFIAMAQALEAACGR